MPICASCGDAIGIYEPIVVIEHGQARRTSFAAEPQLLDAPGLRYHYDCYATDLKQGAESLAG